VIIACEKDDHFCFSLNTTPAYMTGSVSEMAASFAPRLSCRLANVTVEAANHEGAVNVSGISADAYLELEGCTIRCHGGRGVVILQGLARLSNCVVSGCASNGIELNDQRVMQSTKKCVRYVQSKPTLNGQVVVDQGVDLKNPARRVVLLASGETISLKAACVVPLSSSRHAAWPTRHEIEHNEVSSCAIGDKLLLRGSRGAIEVAMHADVLLRRNAIVRNGGRAVCLIREDADEELRKTVEALQQGEDGPVWVKRMSRDERQRMSEEFASKRSRRAGVVELVGNQFADNAGVSGPCDERVEPRDADIDSQQDRKEEASRVRLHELCGGEDAVGPKTELWVMVFCGLIESIGGTIARVHLLQLEPVLTHAGVELPTAAPDQGQTMILSFEAACALQQDREMPKELLLLVRAVLREDAPEDESDSSLSVRVVTAVRQAAGDFISSCADYLPSTPSDDGEPQEALILQKLGNVVVAALEKQPQNYIDFLLRMAVSPDEAEPSLPAELLSILDDPAAMAAWQAGELMLPPDVMAMMEKWADGWRLPGE